MEFVVSGAKADDFISQSYRMLEAPQPNGVQ
jgi:hypothetical protein